MRLRPAGGLDLTTGALLFGGAALIAVALVVAVVLLTPPVAVEPASTPPNVPLPAGRPSEALPADRVAAVLYVDAAVGAGSAAQAGDRVDVLGYFSKQVTGADSVTRILLQDVPVLRIDRTGPNVALTLAVPQQSALLLQEARALGAQPFVTLRATPRGVDAPATNLSAPSSFSDADLAARLAGAH